MKTITMNPGERSARRRILMIAACPFPAPRGTPVRILRIAEALARREHQVHVVTYHLGDRTTPLPFAVHRIPQVPTYRKMDPGPTYQKLTVVDGLLAAKVAALAWSLKPDVIHAHHYEGLLTALPARYAFRIPIVFDSHVLLQSELAYYTLRGLGRAKIRLGRYLDRHLSRRANHVVTVTDDIRMRLLETGVLEHDKVTVACNGVEESFFAGKAGVFPADGRRRILFTGNLALYQGVGLMIEALAHLTRRRTDVRLVVAAGSSDRRSFEKLARDAGVWQHIDFVEASLEQLPSLIASADVALNPRTDCPGLPQKLLNYMASGAAVVSFAGSAKHLRHGETAMIVRNGDIEAFAQAVERLLDDHALRTRLGSEARLYARQHFSWNNCVAVIEDVYDRVLSHVRPVPPDRAGTLSETQPAAASAANAAPGANRAMLSVIQRGVKRLGVGSPSAPR